MFDNHTQKDRQEPVKNERNLMELKFQTETVPASREIQKKCQNARVLKSKVVPIEIQGDRHNRSATLGRHKPVVNQKSNKPIAISLTLVHPTKRIPIQNWRFEKALNIWIGRASNNHVVLLSCVVSRHHVELRQLDGKWILTSFGSNSTYVNDEKISRMCVEDGAIVHLGRTGPAIQINLIESDINENPVQTKLECVGRYSGRSIGC